MLYLGLAVGVILGVCISIILLALVKELALHAESGKETPDILNQQG
jgi:MFS superfamily sulfate permease-like transporter